MKQTVEGFMVPSGEGVLGIKPDCLFSNYQLEVYRFAISKCKDFNVALDIGANVGIMTRRMYLDFHDVVAFEPLFGEYLRKNTEDLKNIVIHDCALGEREETLRMRVGKYNSGGSNIEKDGEREVEVKTLDSFNLTNVDLIKMDVEGWEYYAMAGGQNTFESCSTFMIEIHDDNEKKNKIMKWFKDREFNSHKIGPDYIFWRD